MTQSCIKSITNFQFPSTRKQGRLRQTWSECVKTNVSKCGLAGIDPLYREPLFNIACCCQPHRMGDGKHFNLKMDLDGGMVIGIYYFIDQPVDNVPSMSV